MDTVKRLWAKKKPEFIMSELYRLENIHDGAIRSLVDTRAMDDLGKD
jgi:hypothetical protein